MEKLCFVLVFFSVGWIGLISSVDLPNDPIKPKVELSLVTPNPHEGDDIQLECSAKPKDRSNRTRPDSVHWIKGNVGVPKVGRPGNDAERYVREVTETDKGIILFLLTIKDAEISDADKYMCIVQIGEKGYFTSNEIDISIQPADPDREKVSVKNDESNTGDVVSVLGESSLGQLTKDEKDILRRKDEIVDMTEEEVIFLSKTLKKEKEMKKRREEEEKREEQERIERITREAEKRKKPKLELSQDEIDILQRKDELADMNAEELQLLQKAMKREREIKAKEQDGIKDYATEFAKEEDILKLTKEEEDILKRRHEMRDMSQDELKVLASAIGKENRRKEQEKKANDPLENEEEGNIKDEL